MNLAAFFALPLSVSAAIFARGELQPLSPQPPGVPPPAPPILSRPPVEPFLRAQSAAVYSIGDPTPEEQLYVEMINRARANAQAEALLFANTTDPDVLSAYRGGEAYPPVDLQLMLSQFAIYPPVQPVAINSRLTTAARRQSADMLQNAFQGHTGTDLTTASQRVSQTGYNFLTLGENVYASARSVFYGHAGFEVDWGPGVGGMQTPPGHRNTIHNAAFREVGVGVLFGAKTNTATGFIVGPQLVTQNFATAQGSTPFITGVAYYDLNGNNFYDIGEGIGGVTIEVNGVATRGVTALSGGYALPVPGNGTFTVTFSGAGFSALPRTVTVANNLNQKIDFRPNYTAPSVTGPASPAVGRANTYAISPVGGAAEYQWRVYERTPARNENGENGTANVIVNQTPGYSVLQTQIKAAGTSAFRFAHPQPGPELNPVPQSITFRPTYAISANSAIRFQSRLGWAAADQIARVQLSTDGANWTDVYTQPGSGGRGETIFTQKQVDLGAFAGRQAQVRFLYDPTGGYFPQTDPEVGWYFDEIQFVTVDEVVNVQTQTAAGTSFQFTPVKAGPFTLQASAKTGHNFLDWGPAITVQASASAAPEFHVSRAVRAANELQFTVDLLAGTSTGFSLESKARLADNWANHSATVETQSSTRFVVKTPLPTGNQRFFRVRSN